ncbi:hypothetical protein FXO37_09057 [Capsicum annuum]|nr:hypothetical protein FXO37_09057 [Capsicum annuum]
MGVGEGVKIEKEVKEVLDKAVFLWRKRLISEGGLRKAYDMDVRVLLLLIGCFGIQRGFTNVDIRDLLLLSPFKKNMNGAIMQSNVFMAKKFDGPIRFIERDNTGPINIENPGEFIMLELAENVKKLINPDVQIIIVENTPYDPRQRKPEITKVKTLLGWEPTVKLYDGRLPVRFILSERLKQRGLYPWHGIDTFPVGVTGRLSARVIPSERLDQRGLYPWHGIDTFLAEVIGSTPPVVQGTGSRVSSAVQSQSTSVAPKVVSLVGQALVQDFFMRKSKNAGYCTIIFIGLPSISQCSEVNISCRSISAMRLVHDLKEVVLRSA